MVCVMCGGDKTERQLVCRQCSNRMRQARYYARNKEQVLQKKRDRYLTTYQPTRFIRCMVYHYQQAEPIGMVHNNY